MTDLSSSFARAFLSKGNFKFKDADALELCIQLSYELGLDPNETATHYDTYASLKDLPFDIVQGHIMGFKEFLGKELASNKENTKAKPGFPGKSPLMSRSWEDLPEKIDYPTPKRQATEASIKSAYKAASQVKAQATPPLMSTPGVIRKTIPAMTPPSTVTKFSSRTNKGQVVSTFNEVGRPAAMQMQRESLASKAQSACPLEVVGELMSGVGYSHLHMNDPVEVKVQAIEERVQDFTEAFKRWLPEEAADVDRTSVVGVTQAPVWVVGRVVSDTEDRMNDASVLLEGSRMASDGARVRLDLSKLPSFRLFPGQVLAVKGLNPTGKCFVVHQLHSHLPATAPAPEPEATSSSAASRAPLSIVAAAGPFTSSEDMLYQPLDELLAFCSDKQPDALLLMGPFINVDHPLISEGRLDCSFDEVFRDQVLSRVVSWQQGHPGTRVALMPAVKDAHAPPVFPQPALPLAPPPACSSAASPLPEARGPAPGGTGPSNAGQLSCGGVRSLQNPVSFTLGAQGQQPRVLVAASSTDVLRHLSASEVSRHPSGIAPPDRMAALAAHVVGQRNFYPLYPPHLGTCLDSSQSTQLQLPHRTPNLLLLPSDLTPFAKLLPNAGCTSLPEGAQPGSEQPALSTVCINPGRLVKGTSGGTFAHILVQPGTDLSVRAENVSVEILRV